MENLAKNNLTELENQVLIAISNGDEFDEMPAECTENIADETGLSTKVIRAITSSLLKKGLIEVGEYPNGLKCFYFLNK